MAINLADIPSAVQTYLNTKVTVAITDVTPADGDGTKINPGEDFVVHLETTNAAATSGGVAIRNLKYRLTVADGSVAKLIVPGTLTWDVPLVAASLAVGAVFASASMLAFHQNQHLRGIVTAAGLFLSLIHISSPRD